MCRLEKRFFLGLLFLLLGASFVYSQSFEAARVYRVTGTTLNRLSKDLLTAQGAFEAQQSESLQLKTQLATLSDDLSKSQMALTQSQSNLQAASRQLTTVSQSFQKLQASQLMTSIEIGGASALAGGLVVVILHIIGVIK